MGTRYFGERVKRSEDPRLLTGRGLYVDDIRPPGVVHAAFLRSPHAHARILRIDVSRARAAPGVAAVYTRADLPPALAAPLPKLIPHPALLHHKTQYALAPEKVRYAGEPVALVIAENRYVAEDAVELIEVEYDPLPAVVDLEQAARPNAPLVHEDIGTNVCAHYTQRVGNVEEAFARAAHVFRERFVFDRGASAPLECRGIVAQWEAKLRQLTVWDSTQAPIRIRNYLSQLLGLPQQDVRVIAPDIGGGFGPKIMMCYPEEVLIPWAAMQLNRPVKWIEDRREHFVATNQERLQIHDAAIAVDADGRILGVRTEFLYDSGAYIPYGIIVPIVASTTLPGPYKIPNYHCEFKAVFTNKTIVSPYRGAGRPHGVFVMERLLDRVARELGLDRAIVRERNFIQPDEFPYEVGLIYQDNAPVVYDSGDYPATLRKAMEMIDYAGWPERRKQFRREGRYVGLGIACYVEGSGIGPYEGCRVTVEPSGKVFAATSVGTQGQGHYTSFAQIVADALTVPVEDVTVVTGDSGAFSWGTGTFASRAAVVAGNAVYLAAQAVREKALQVAATRLEARVEDLEMADGKVFVRGTPGRAMTLAEIAVAANPLRGTIPREWDQPGLEASRYFAPSGGTWPNGAHACLVEVDPQTGMLSVLKYVVVHDCGRVINPLILEGQIRGGVAQGLGGAFYERLVYDESGQLLTQTFMDYLLPTAAEVPVVEIGHLETPSPRNPLGVKGAGEAGVIPVGALIAQAVEDALQEFGVRITEMPLSPSRLLEIITAALAVGAR
ncbi:MAG: xanthine dehydrogenase family protein molybdopterin-binding subunit [Armatimonadota bacterium]|nr:xanthine dehydrogenase family protein molybdopterin-binding subunit [Armatimonadota bacterium]MDR7452308.1 xanthine dehydrogenase family protein molybdopterin-binding subunit [Armatimonadota bacterium]MDR7467801.1 xanthine dehydrogenase family protein molybdopterin-binding subunit [Armatimonadota bacterium]MDR7494613.1 xanthine dehydrogenase family protein molybdopterin-binding subunit [Armatimonadota bacterium]MDR7499673.1 xanthine dehydrogenase family protein molybdopterin-binding subunit 